MTVPSIKVAANANGTCSSCLRNRVVAGKKPISSPVIGSVMVFSCWKSFLLESIFETPLTPHRTPRSYSWCFQYSVNTVHQMALARP
jgi:hypothetical protein